MGLGFIAVAIRGGDAIAPNTAWFSVSLLLVTGAYYVVSWVRGGQTLGMRAWRLHVVPNHGSKLSVRNAVLRFAAMLISIVCAGVGVVWALVERDRRMWHDLASHSQIGFREP